MKSSFVKAISWSLNICSLIRSKEWRNLSESMYCLQYRFNSWLTVSNYHVLWRTYHDGLTIPIRRKQLVRFSLSSKKCFCIITRNLLVKLFFERRPRSNRSRYVTVTDRCRMQVNNWCDFDRIVVSSSVKGKFLKSTYFISFIVSNFHKIQKDPTRKVILRTRIK